MDRFTEPPLTGSFCDVLWADPLLEEVLGYRLSDKDYVEVSQDGKRKPLLFFQRLYQYLGTHPSPSLDYSIFFSF